MLYRQLHPSCMKNFRCAEVILNKTPTGLYEERGVYCNAGSPEKHDRGLLADGLGEGGACDCHACHAGGEAEGKTGGVVEGWKEEGWRVRVEW